MLRGVDDGGGDGWPRVRRGERGPLMAGEGDSGGVRWPTDSYRIVVLFMPLSRQIEVSDLAEGAPGVLSGGRPGSDTGCVVWLHQGFHRHRNPGA